MYIWISALDHRAIVLDKMHIVQWSDFKDNVNSAFGKLRSDNDFTDVTLTCGDGQHFESHKIVLAASSPFFEKIFQKTKHPCPLIYLGEFKSNHFASILDFLFLVKQMLFQEDLDSFLSIAEELMLKGLTGQTSKELLEQREKLDRIETSKAQSGINQELKLGRIETAKESLQRFVSRIHHFQKRSDFQ